MKVELTKKLIDRIISLHAEYRYYTEFTTTSEEDYIYNKITKEL